MWRGEEGAGAGRVAVFGTAAVFEASRLEHPGNATACDALFGWLCPVRCVVLRRRRKVFDVEKGEGQAG